MVSGSCKNWPDTFVQVPRALENEVAESDVGNEFWNRYRTLLETMVECGYLIVRLISHFSGTLQCDVGIRRKTTVERDWWEPIPPVIERYFHNKDVITINFMSLMLHNIKISVSPGWSWELWSSFLTHNGIVVSANSTIHGIIWWGELKSRHPFKFERSHWFRYSEVESEKVDPLPLPISWMKSSRLSSKGTNTRDISGISRWSDDVEDVKTKILQNPILFSPLFAACRRQSKFTDSSFIGNMHIIW
jgi:hypothetical protein